MKTSEKNKTELTVQEQLRFLTKSEIRIAILNCLKNAPYSVKEIVKITGMRYSSVSSNINKLEKNNNIYKKEGKFYMTFLTQMYLENILDFNQSLKIITDFKTFWNKHNIDDIDHNSIKNLTDIYKSELIESTSVDIYKTYNTIKSQIIGSQNIKGIFPYLHPDYPKIIEEELENGATVDLIVNDSIYKNLIFAIDDQIRRNSIKEGKLKVKSIRNHLNIYLAICDDKMSLGLFKNDESYDQNRILVSKNKEALQWSEKLFNHLKKTSR